MFKWLLSRPLQIKFFVSTVMLVSIALLMLMLNMMQVHNQFLTRHIKEDMQQRTHILAMTLMIGPAAHDPNDLRKLLRDVMDIHGYCYLSVQDAKGKLLASVGDVASATRSLPEAVTTNGRSMCFNGAIPLIHDGERFGMLHYGVNTDFVGVLERSLGKQLFIVAALWLCLGSVMYFVLVRRLVKPLQEITRASESMANGNLNASMPEGLPQDELGKLATGFNNMAVALRGRVESQQRYAHALYAEQARLNALISILPVGVLFVDPDGKVQHLNQECRSLWGFPESEDYIGHREIDLIEQARDRIEQPDIFIQQMSATIKEYGTSPPFDTRLCNDRVVRCRSCVVPDAAGERYIGRVWMFEDVTGEYAQLHEAQSRAERDILTGLYNRRRFEEDLECMFAKAQRDESRLTLLYFDLDDFKNINDIHGHHSGDKVLKAVAQALTLQSRRNENLYRLGGDEFGILVADTELNQVERLVKRVISTVEKLRLDMDGHAVHVRCSMGIAVRSPAAPPGTPTELMQQADIAMYQAKRAGKNRWHIFDPAQALDLGKDSR
ncbi:MAG: diguanylate cyclase [Nitrosomonadales bacterium]|nr:diguanylate cyclase [Nitrosomonadales bacterium]